MSVGTGIGGSDVIQGRIPLAQLGNPSQVQIIATSDVGGRVDVAGNRWAGITLRSMGTVAQPVPATGALALGLLLLAVFALSFVTYRRRYGRYHWVLLIMVLPVVLTAAWALTWTTIVTDAAESGNGGDIRQLRLAADGSALHIQLHTHIGTPAPANQAPTDIALSNSSVAENAAGAVIGNLSTTDPDSGDSHTYSVSDSRFEVLGSQLKLKAGQALDYETEASVTLTVTTTDNGSLTYSKMFTLTVTNVNEAPTDIALSNSSVAENAAGAVIGNLSTTDPDSGDSHTYSVSDSRFEVVGNQLKLKAGQALDYETETSVTLTVTSTDSGGLSVSKDFKLTVTDDASDNVTGKLNDTGITWGGNYPSGNNSNCTGAEIAAQDCSHGRDAAALAGTLTKVGGGIAGFDFTKLDSSGNNLSATAPTWSCVRDNVTGLVWEVKDNNGGLHDKNNTYTWYNPDNSNNGGVAGTQNGGTCSGGGDCDTSGFVTAVNAAGLCGQNDWRVPAREELRSIVDYSRYNPAIDTDYFPNTQYSSSWPYGFYWSSSPYADHRNYAWGVYFGYGGGNSNSKDVSRYVRLVRGGQ